MAIKEPYMVKQILGDNELTLEAKAGESLLVKDIMIYNPTLEKYLTIAIEKATVGYFRTSGFLGGHLPMISESGQHAHDIISTATAPAATAELEREDAHGSTPGTATISGDGIAGVTVFKKPMEFTKAGTPRETILGLLGRLGLFAGYPIEEGQTLKFSGVKEADAVQLVIYQVGDAGDYLKSAPNGSEAAEYLFLNYGQVATALTVAGSTIYDTGKSPAEFPDFPYAKDVPAKMEIDLLGILASPVRDWDAATQITYSTYLKLIRERVTLFDDDKNGLLMLGTGLADAAATIVGEGQSLIGNYSDVDRRLPFLLDPPITFTPGEELGVYITHAVVTGAASIAAAHAEIALIERVRRV